MNPDPVYLDYNATTPCDPRVVEAMLPYFTHHFGNAASADHRYGWKARDAVEEAREQVASLIGASAKQIVFTSGATEAINFALKGIMGSHASKGNHIITCKTEHKAVLDTCAFLASKGYRVTYLDVDTAGNISLEALEHAIDGSTVCIALMHANNETGVVHPIAEIGRVAQRHNIIFFCDATQSAGKIPLDVQSAGVDLLAFSSHKIYGPKGVGALFLKKTNEDWRPATLHHGGVHENGLRSGTLNTTGIVGFGMAAAISKKEMMQDATRMETLRNDLERKLLEKIPGLKINGSGRRLPNTSNITLPGIDAEQLLLSLSPYLALSRGSACSGLVQQPSHVLLAMGLTEKEARSVIRFSLGRFTTAEEVEEVVNCNFSMVDGR